MTNPIDQLKEDLASFRRGEILTMINEEIEGLDQPGEKPLNPADFDVLDFVAEWDNIPTVVEAQPLTMRELVFGKK